jgi:hypothetical protein
MPRGRGAATTRKQGVQQAGEDYGNLVKRVSQEDFREFVAAPYAIIKAGSGETPGGVHYALQFRLGVFHVPLVKLGVVDLDAIEWTGGVRLYVHFKLAELKMNADSSGRPPPGYYLFARGALLAFHPGHIDLEHDGGALGAAALTGLIALIAKSESVAQLVPQIATWSAGERVAESFDEVIREHMASFFSASSEEDEEDVPSGDSKAEVPLHHAFEVLGLSPDASDEAVRAAHKRLIREHHPDKAGKSALEQERANSRSAELNAARDFILKQRKQDKRS